LRTALFTHCRKTLAAYGRTETDGCAEPGFPLKKALPFVSPTLRFDADLKNGGWFGLARVKLDQQQASFKVRKVNNFY
jgi:hypothetical protein